MTILRTLPGSLIILFVFFSIAHAYVDPGVTGMIFQFGYAVIIAVIVWFAGLRSVFKRIHLRDGEGIKFTAHQDRGIGTEILVDSGDAVSSETCEYLCGVVGFQEAVDPAGRLLLTTRQFGRFVEQLAELD